MARPVRIEFSGAFYHVTSRGDRREGSQQIGLDQDGEKGAYHPNIIDPAGVKK